MIAMQRDHGLPHFKPQFEFSNNKVSVLSPSLERVKNEVMLAFMRDVDFKMRKSLIDLGWTPPKDGRQ
jgi:hypothetical protein